MRTYRTNPRKYPTIIYWLELKNTTGLMHTPVFNNPIRLIANVMSKQTVNLAGQMESPLGLFSIRLPRNMLNIKIKDRIVIDNNRYEIVQTDTTLYNQKEIGLIVQYEEAGPYPFAGMVLEGPLYG